MLPHCENCSSTVFCKLNMPNIITELSLYFLHQAFLFLSLSLFYICTVNASNIMLLHCTSLCYVPLCGLYVLYDVGCIYCYLLSTLVAFLDVPGWELPTLNSTAQLCCCVCVGVCSSVCVNSKKVCFLVTLPALSCACKILNEKKNCRATRTLPCAWPPFCGQTRFRSCNLL